MGSYALLNEAEAQEIYDQFPRIDAAALTEQVNDLFTPYLFFHRERDGIALWCSCCREHGTMDKLPRTIGMIEACILWGKHGDKAICPYCGREVTLKNVSRLGKRKNLLEHHPVIFLTARDGGLYARCCWARKDYQKDLCEPPLFMTTCAIHFAIGRSETISEVWKPNGETGYARRVLEGNYDPVHRVITEPFTDVDGICGWPHYAPYYVIGLEEIAKSDFRYCQYERFWLARCDHEKRPLHSDLCKYLAACSIYPRQIEMLMKTGGKDLVWDLVAGRKKNRNVLKWDAADPCAAFGLDKAEFRAWRESGCSVYTIAAYKRLRRKGLTTGFDSLRKLENALPQYMIREFTETCVREGVRPDRLRHYFDRFTGPRCHGGFYTLGMAKADADTAGRLRAAVGAQIEGWRAAPC